jgi:hypothetical protein
LFVQLLLQRPDAHATSSEVKGQLAKASLAARELALGQGKGRHSSSHSSRAPSLAGYSPSQHVIDAIRSANRLDELVYAHATKTFQAASRRVEARV